MDNLKVGSQSEKLTDPTEIAHNFIFVYTNIGPDLASKINCNGNHISRYLSEPKQNAMFLIPTTWNNERIQKQSSCYDGRSTKLLKQLFLILCHHWNISWPIVTINRMCNLGTQFIEATVLDRGQ